jgi:uncharacterized protein affecting Mg2+/Co2+ transport
MTLRGSIETYADNPSDEKAYGSVKITNGVKITSVAYYNHLISEFDSMQDPVNKKDTYVFSYQIKIRDDPDSDEPFYKCQLTTRTWIITKGPSFTEEVRDQPGVIGQYPIIYKDMECPFIYESQCPTHIFGTKMRGYFTFKYLEGPNKDQTFKAEVGEYEMRIPEG